MPARCSRGQCKGLRFDLDEHPAERSYVPVEVRSIGPFQIGEKAPDPGLKVLLEQFALGALGSAKAPARQPGHDLAQNRRVILGLRLAGGSLDGELFKMRAQPRERSLVQEAGEIVRRVGQKLPAAEPDEEVEIFALQALDLGPRRRRRQPGSLPPHPNPAWGFFLFISIRLYVPPAANAGQ